MRNIMVQVWDNMIIESALKTFYSKDLSAMTQAIQKNITVCEVANLVHKTWLLTYERLRIPLSLMSLIYMVPF